MIHIANHDYEIVHWPSKYEEVKRGSALSRLLSNGMRKIMENQVIVKCGGKRTYGVVARGKQL